MEELTEVMIESRIKDVREMLSEYGYCMVPVSLLNYPLVRAALERCVVSGYLRCGFIRFDEVEEG